MTETPTEKLARQRRLVTTSLADSARKNEEYWRERANKAENKCNKLKGELERANLLTAKLEAEINWLADVETTARHNARLLEHERATNKALQARLEKALTRIQAPEDAMPTAPATRGRSKLFYN